MISCANNILFSRYEAIATGQQGDPHADHPRLSLVNLAWMCREARLSQDPFPADKADRWLGFVQGCLAMRGLIDVDAERDISRPLFARAAREAGIDPGPTRERIDICMNTRRTA
jgi:hypothetical protein